MKLDIQQIKTLVLENLTLREKRIISSLPKDKLLILNMSIGRDIRNEHNLFQRKIIYNNKEIDATQASMFIIEMIWEELTKG
jgi:hypothetical protein